MSDTRRIRVAHFITELNVGGAEKLVSQLAAGLDRSRFHSKVICLYDAGEVAKEIRSGGVVVHNLGVSGKRDLRAAYRLFHVLKQWKIDILHAHLFHPTVLGTVVGRLAGVPVIVSTRHGIEIGGSLRDIANASVAGFRDRTITVSEYVRQVELQRTRQGRSKVIVIPNGVNNQSLSVLDPALVASFRAEWNLTTDDIVIGTVARFVEQKGLGYLLAAAKKLRFTYPKLKLLLIGDGPLEQQLRQKTLEFGLGENVVFGGIRTEIAEILSIMDVMVMPSILEGFGIAILEAMACGVPVVATDVGGIPEVVANGDTGILVPARSSEALAKAIGILLADPVIRKQMADLGRTRAVNEFDITRTISKIEDLYRLLLQNKTGFGVTPLPE